MSEIRNKLIELIAKAKRSMWGKKGMSCELARNSFVAEYLLANGVTVQRWIPVTERLPEDGVQVLACTKHGKAFPAHCERRKWRVSHSVTITHWMPLPQPPKEGK